jgi:hypothetical protein
MDPVGDAGQHNSIVVGTDGRPLIAYQEVINDDLKIAYCGDESCSTGCGSGATCLTVDGDGAPGGADVGVYNSLAIGADGLPVISYQDRANLDLKVMKCAKPSCIP